MTERPDPPPPVGRRGGARDPGGRRTAGRGGRGGQRARSAVRTTAVLVGGTARGTGRAAVGTARRLRRATHAKGAGETGLGRLIELHALNYAGDALVAVALANTLFFSVPVGEARWRVALYLLLTMAPFALLAPVLGPLLDRLRSGRRWALSGTFVVRACLAAVMAGAVVGEQDPLRLYPAAFGVLVLSRAYGILRATVVPRLLPPSIGLVQANGRAQMAGVAAASVAAVAGVGLSALAGPRWVLLLTAALMAGGAVLSLRLPRTIDSAEGEVDARMSAEPEPDGRPRRWNVGPAVVRAVRANAAVRAFAGFLTLYLAFLLREEPLPGVSNEVALGIVVAGAALGSGTGTTVGGLLRERRPDAIVVGVLLVATTAAGVAAWLYGGALVLALVAAAAGFAQSLGKLALDSIVQREVPEQVRTSTFARTETVLQLAWVGGGGLGIVLPLALTGPQGLLVAATGLVLAVVTTLRTPVSRPVPAGPAASTSRAGDASLS